MNDTSQQLCCFRCCSVPNFNFNIEVNIIWALLESKVQSFLKLILQLLFSLNSVKQTETYTEVISPHFRSENKSYIDFIYHNEKNSNQKSENILDLISRQFNYSVSEKISKKTGKTRHFISRHLHFLRSQKKVYFSPKMPKSASSTVEKRVMYLSLNS